MAQPTLPLCLLGLFLTGCYAQVTQPPSEFVSPGGTVQLPCTLEGSYTVSANRVVWIQQKPGSVPRYLLYFFTESNKGMGSGVPSRFAGSRSGSNKIGYLTITGAQAEDDAIYYCVTWTGSACTALPSYGEVRQKPSHSTAALRRLVAEKLRQPSSVAGSPGNTVRSPAPQRAKSAPHGKDGTQTGLSTRPSGPLRNVRGSPTEHGHITAQ
ncbi:Immunoglobulin omega chain [Chelonia mydas]|nr:Immunoglobulin omega chain [Chelonia mydas]